MDIKDFKSELKALLEKYNAEIWVELDGDTHCVSSTIKVEIDSKNFTLTKGDTINSYDL